MFCILGDCNNKNCHHCFPVKDCSLTHDWCKTHGCCKELFNHNNEEHILLLKKQQFINKQTKILVTGCAGFIGSHLCEYLLKENHVVIGIDNVNDYYDVKKKCANLEILSKFANFLFIKENICDTNVITEFKPTKIVHLASMAGVRYSLQNPLLYEKTNIGGFIHILEQCKINNIEQIIYASSSSVYGLNSKVPFAEEDTLLKCNSPYACSKLCMEIYARLYYQLYGIKSIGLRFFTVYGPRGRPDMAPYMFLNSIKETIKFNKFGDGTTSSDYTYIDDIIQGIIGALNNKNNVECEIYNLGNSIPISLNEFIETCEIVTGKKALFEQLPMQDGDVPHTYADISKAKTDLDYEPKTSLKEGLSKLYKSLL